MALKTKLRCLSMLLILSFISLAAYASQQTLLHPQDPYEHYNRQMFQFNQTLDEHFLQPVAKGYRYIVPPVARTGVTNFFTNFEQPTVMVNDLLQGDFVNFMGDSWRLLINSTLGLFGIFDVASHMNVPIHYHQNDFGLTMARWGVKHSPYFVIPFLGGSTARDAFGMLIDYNVFSPFSWIRPRWKRYAINGFYYINLRAHYLDYQNILSFAALDPYIFQRNAYLQRRQYLIGLMEESIAEQHAAHGNSQPGFLLKPTHAWRESSHHSK